MRLSVVVAGEGAPDNAFVVWRGYEASIQKAAAMGYDGVELALSDADDVNRTQIERVVRACGIRVSCISTGLVYAQRGLYMTHPDSTVRQKTVDTFLGLIDLAAEWGGLLNIGRARGFVDCTQSRQYARGLFEECINALLPRAEQCGVTLLIEPVNRYETNFVNSLDDAAEILDGLGGRRLGIMADLFHMNIEDDSITASLTRNARYIKYVHAADSNRKAPGLGHTDFPAIIHTLREIGYDGWLGAEILPGENPDEMAARAARYLKTLI